MLYITISRRKSEEISKSDMGIYRIILNMNFKYPFQVDICLLCVGF